MIDLAAQQAKFREKRRDQLARQKEFYNAGQAFQLVLDEINAKLRATGVADLPASDPLKVKQAALAAAMPGLQEAAKNAEQAVRGLFDELYAETDFQKLLAELKGDAPFLLFPVRAGNALLPHAAFRKARQQGLVPRFFKRECPGLAPWLGLANKLRRNGFASAGAISGAHRHKRSAFQFHH